MNACMRDELISEGGMSLELALNLLKGYKCVAGDDTEYWYEYAWHLLEEKGLMKISVENPVELIFVHLGVLGMLTEEFQSLLLDEDSLFEYEYCRYINELSVSDLETLCEQLGDQVIHGEDEDDEAEGMDEEELARVILEHDRHRVVTALVCNQEAFKALVLASRFPGGIYDEYADRIEVEYPVDVDGLRDRDSFRSYDEYCRFMKTDDADDFVYNIDHDDIGVRKSHEWWSEGCHKLDVC